MGKSAAASSKVLSLQKANPEATLFDCRRFLDGFGKRHASKHLKEYLGWRAKFCCFDHQHSNIDDKASWEHASSITMALVSHGDDNEAFECASVSSTMGSGGETEDEEDFLREVPPIPSQGKQLVMASHQYGNLKKLSPKDQDISSPLRPMNNRGSSLPRFVFSHVKEGGHVMRDLSGHRLIQALPARMEIEYSSEQYTMALATYLECLFCDDIEESFDQATVLLDVRPGRGWPNANAAHMVGFIRHIANTLHTLHPNRLHKCILFPIPRPAIVLWNVAIRPFLDHRLCQTIELVPGTGANLKSPPPNDKLASFVAMEDLQYLEKHRLSCFQNSRATHVDTSMAAICTATPTNA